jgi:ATP-dependent helicase/DNAse subunit B
VEAVENPEDRLEITALDRGSLVHEALERFMLEVLARPEHEQPGPDQSWTAADRERMAEIGSRLCDDYEARGLTGRPIFWRRDRAHILADLQRFLDIDDGNRRKHRTRPLAAELAFGFDDTGVEAVPLELSDGRRLRFRGKADRVDLTEDGELHIVDYKTGRHDSYRSLSEDDPDQRGRRLQLAVYGAAARLHQQRPDAPVVAGYWFVSSKGQFKHFGYRVTDAVLERVGTTLDTIVRGIEQGVFAAHPTAISTALWVDCHPCDPDALGVTELRRAWDRKRLDPALAPYAQLAEPLDESDAIEEELPGGLG